MLYIPYCPLKTLGIQLFTPFNFLKPDPDTPMKTRLIIFGILLLLMLPLSLVAGGLECCFLPRQYCSEVTMEVKLDYAGTDFKRPGQNMGKGGACHSPCQTKRRADHADCICNRLSVCLSRRCHSRDRAGGTENASLNRFFTL